MATTPDQLKLIISSADSSTVKLFLRPPSSSVASVMDWWVEETGSDRDFVLCNGIDALSTDSRLGDVEETHPGILCLTARRPAPLYISVFGSSAAKKTLSLLLTMTPLQLQSRLRQEFDLPPQRSFRLLTSQSILDDNRSLLSSGVTAGSRLKVDLRLRVLLEDAWTSASSSFSLFASDRVSQLCGVQDRLVHRSSPLSRSATLAQVADRTGEVHLIRETRRELPVLVSGAVRGVSVWPSDCPSGLRLPSPLCLGGSPLNAHATVANAVPSPAALVHAPDLPLTLRIGEYRLLVRVPREGIVADLRQIACRRLKSEQVRLWVCGQPLIDDAAAVSGLGLRDGGEVAVEVGGIPVVVHVDGRTLRWRSQFPRLNRTMILEELQEHGDFDVSSDATITCVGCGRQLREGQEQFQVVPASCCREESLELTLTAKRDAVIQTMEKFDNLTPPRIDNKYVSTDEWLISDLSKDIALNLEMPDGNSLWHLVGNETTLEELIRDLRGAGKLVSLTSFKNQHGSLTDRRDWSHQTMVECNIRNEGKLKIEAELLQQVDVNIRGPGDRLGHWYTVFVELGECFVKSVMTQIEIYHNFQHDDSTLVLQFGNLYLSDNKTLRRAIDSTESTNFAVKDLDNGRSVSNDRCSYQVMEILSLESGIPAAFQSAPILTVSMNNIFWCLIDKNSFDFMEVEKNKLFDNLYVTQIEFLRVKDKRNGQTSLFIELAIGYGNCETGKFAGENEEEVINSQRSIPFEHQEWNRCLLLLKNDDLVPKFKLPVTATVAIFVRDNIPLKILNNRIVSPYIGFNEKKQNSSTWTFMRSGKYTGRFSEFEKAFTASMSR